MPTLHYSILGRRNYLLYSKLIEQRYKITTFGRVLNYGKEEKPSFCCLLAKALGHTFLRGGWAGPGCSCACSASYAVLFREIFQWCQQWKDMGKAICSWKGLVLYCGISADSGWVSQGYSRSVVMSLCLGSSGLDLELCLFLFANLDFIKL